MPAPQRVETAEDHRAALADLLNSLTNQPPVDDTVIERFENLRESARIFGETVLRNCPLNRERSLAITNLEQALMWAVKSIACHQGDTPGGEAP